jgi:hypothetical protein
MTYSYKASSVYVVDGYYYGHTSHTGSDRLKSGEIKWLSTEDGTQKKSFAQANKLAGSLANDRTDAIMQFEHLSSDRQRTKNKRTAAHVSFDIGIAEGGARTHDLEVDLLAVIRATRSTN